MNITIADTFSDELKSKLSPYGEVSNNSSKKTEALLIIKNTRKL